VDLNQFQAQPVLDQLAAPPLARAPATICAGVLDATPLPLEELPQPQSMTTASTAATSRPAGDVGRGRIAAQTLAIDPADQPAAIAH
jgi:hypothetical protein